MTKRSLYETFSNPLWPGSREHEVKRRRLAWQYISLYPEESKIIERIPKSFVPPLDNAAPPLRDAADAALPLGDAPPPLGDAALPLRDAEFPLEDEDFHLEDEAFPLEDEDIPLR
jgi:hypothetical protein